MSSVSSHYPIMLSLSLVCLYATFTSIGNINTVYLSCCLQGKIYAKMWVFMTMSSIRCVHPQYFRSYGATPIKGDSESFRPYYRLVKFIKQPPPVLSKTQYYFLSLPTTVYQYKRNVTELKLSVFVPQVWNKYLFIFGI